MRMFTLISLTVILLSPLINAAPKTYQITQKVTDKSKASLTLHTQIGLRKLLTQQAAIPIVLPKDLEQKKLEAIVDRYEYAKSDQTLDYMLTLQFNNAHIQSLMKKYNIIPWEGKRPSTLVWLQDISSPPNTSMAITLNQILLPIIRDEATRRNLQILSPDNDIIDLQILSEEPQNFSLGLLRKKYAVDQILYGLITQTEHSIHITWHLFNPKKNLTWHTQNDTVQAGFQEATSYWVTQQKNQEIETNKMYSRIEVSGLINLDNFEIFHTQLCQIDNIEQVEIKDIYHNTFIVEVTHRGSTDDLISQLQPVTFLQSNIESFGNLNTVASYQWTTTTKTAYHHD